MAITALTIYNDALSQLGARRLATVDDAVEEQRIISEVYDDCRDSVLAEHPWTFAQKRAALIDMTTPDVDLWLTETAYEEDDEVSFDGTYYTCLVDHTSDEFAGDLSSAYWETSTTWVTGTSYKLGDKVYNSGVGYACLTPHTAGTFATDLAAVKWIISETLAMDDDGMNYVYYRPTDYIELNAVNYRYARVKVEGARILSDTSALKIRYTYALDTPSLYTAQFRKALATKIASEVAFSLTQSRTVAEAIFEKYTKIVLPSAISSDSQQGNPAQARQDMWENARLSGGTGYETFNEGVWHPY